jgi:Tol biopolymer transport system component
MGLRRTRISAALIIVLCVVVVIVAPSSAPALTEHPLPIIERASVSGTGVQADAGSWWPSLSADGRFIAFLSSDANLVPGDTNAQVDVFLKDLESGSITRASVSDGGGEAAAESQAAALSGGGRYVVFDSYATNLVMGDTNDVSDIFEHDLVSGKTVRISVSSAGTQANGVSYAPSVDLSGSYVTFDSAASNLVDGDTNGVFDIFVRDLGARTTSRISVSASGQQANGTSDWPSISADGRCVTFSSVADNLVSGDTNGVADIFLHDRLTGETERVSMSMGGGQSDGAGHGASLSADGRYVTFSSSATNLVAADANGVTNAFVRDRVARTTHLVSVPTRGTPADGDSYDSVLSADGRFVAFDSQAGNLVPGDTGGEDYEDVFIRDLRTGKLERVSTSADGGEPDATCGMPSLSADGRYAAFRTAATNVVEGDTNDASDVFVVDRGLQSIPTAFADIGGSPYRTAIEDLSGLGIVDGYAAGPVSEFRPQNTLWRAQFAKMLNGAWGLIVDEYLPIPFADLGPDVPDDLYPHEHVAVAAQHGITKGITPTTFGPYLNLTRAQLVTMVVRSLQTFSPDTLSTPPAAWSGVLATTDPTHGLSIKLAEYNGLLDGVALPGWDVWQDARRGETAQVLYNVREMRE